MHSRLLTFVFLALLSLPAAGAAVDVYLFWAVGCPHCERAIEHLDWLAAAEPELRLHKIEVSRSRANAALMLEAAERLGVEAGSVPLTVVGDRAWVGFDERTGREIAAHVAACLEKECSATRSSLIMSSSQRLAPDVLGVAARREPLRVEVRLAVELHDARRDLVGVLLLLVRLGEELRRHRVGVDPGGHAQGLRREA